MSNTVEVNNQIPENQNVMISIVARCIDWVVCMIMPISWQYTNVYEVIICYITNNLDPTNYMLNFGIISLHELRHKVIIRFTLKNIRNNIKKSWTQLLEGEP